MHRTIKSLTVLFAIGLTISLAAPGESSGFSFPATGISNQPSAIFLPIDDASLPLRRNLQVTFEKPTVIAEPVLTPDRDNPNAPDYLAAHFYGTVLFDHDKFRMWYYACHTGVNPDWPPNLQTQAARWKDNVIPGPLCYAESLDGIHWTKPKLGQLLFKGSRDNNAIDLPSALTGDACVLRDDADPDPTRRYKLAYWSQFDPFDFPTMRLATSPDGIVWKAAAEPPIKSFLEHCGLYKYNNTFFANSQTLASPRNGESAARVGTAWLSHDFDHWLPESALSFALPWKPDPVRDEVHLGVAPVAYPNVLVGLYCIWHNDPDFGKISGDLGLVVSNDGIAFREPEKGLVWLSAKDSAAAPLPGHTLPTVLCQSNGILNVADQTLIYHGRWRNFDYRKADLPVESYWAEIALATLPRDRWAALELVPGTEEGSAWSAPVMLPEGGCDVYLNGEGLSGIRLSIADDTFTPDPSFTDANTGTAAIDSGLDVPIRWTNGDLKPLAGKTVRFKMGFKKGAASLPRLYAVYLRPHVERSAETTGATATDFTVVVGDHAVNARVLTPSSDRLVQNPAIVLTFATDRVNSLTQYPYCLPAEYFLAQGHRAVSIDLPCHGERITEFGSQIAGFRNMVVAGHDPFAVLAADVQAVLTECINRNLARPGRIAVCGTSRGGYMALRAFAADPRIAAAAAFAPVTDWSLLLEFANDKDNPLFAPLRLSNFVPNFGSRPVYIAIGKTDTRVSTESCQQLADGVTKTNPNLQFRLTDDKGHSLSDPYYQEAREFLLKSLN